MVNNPKFYLFVFILVSFFSICIAEDFWMKLGFNEGADKMYYSSQDEIYITKSETPNYSFRSLDKGITWENYPDILNYPHTIGGVEYISDDGNYLYVRSMDSLYVVHRDSSDLRKLLDLRFMTMSKIKHNFYFLTGGRVIKADENLKDTTIVLETDTSTEPFYAIAADSMGTLYAGSIDFMFEGGLYKSFDNGDTWEGPDSALLNHFIRAINVDSEGRIFIGTLGHGTLGGGRILRSTDNGTSFQQVAGNGVYVRSMAINNDDEIFAGLSDDWGFLGIAYSSDHGDTWTFINEGLGGELSEGGAGGINDIAISPDGYVYLATDGGVYRSVKSTTGLENTTTQLPNEPVLYQNYPNPFNNETIIDFRLDKSCHVQLNIFNSKGELIKNIKNQKMSKGHHSVNLNADNLVSGVYFYSLKVNNKTVFTKKMLFLK